MQERVCGGTEFLKIVAGQCKASSVCNLAVKRASVGQATVASAVAEVAAEAAAGDEFAWLGDIIPSDEGEVGP